MSLVHLYQKPNNLQDIQSCDILKLCFGALCKKPKANVGTNNNK